MDISPASRWVRGSGLLRRLRRAAVGLMRGLLALVVAIAALACAIPLVALGLLAGLVAWINGRFLRQDPEPARPTGYAVHELERFKGSLGEWVRQGRGRREGTTS